MLFFSLVVHTLKETLIKLKFMIQFIKDKNVLNVKSSIRECNVKNYVRPDILNYSNILIRVNTYYQVTYVVGI